jgi:NAD(P)-dependent dehydrogenase (short-subunit alcohol dehydrogenase family)
VDVSCESEVAAALASCVSRHGGLAIVANAAAAHPFGTVLNTDMAIWERCMAVNVGSICLTARFGIPHNATQGGGCPRRFRFTGLGAHAAHHASVIDHQYLKSQ